MSSGAGTCRQQDDGDWLEALRDNQKPFSRQQHDGDWLEALRDNQKPFSRQQHDGDWLEALRDNQKPFSRQKDDGDWLETLRDKQKDDGDWLETLRDKQKDDGDWLETLRDKQKDDGDWLETLRDKQKDDGDWLETLRDKQKDDGDWLETLRDKQKDDGDWLEALRDKQKSFSDCERAQRWRLSLASLLFLTVLLSHHLWFCAEAKLARSRDKSSLSPQTRSARRSLADDIFVGNSSQHLCCQKDTCLTLADADHLCRLLSHNEVNMSHLYLSFCNSYSLLDLFFGSSSPDHLNCSLDVLADRDTSRCSLCVQAYQSLDLHAQEKYDDFELLTWKYEPALYSVRSCMSQCKTAYKPWLCAQYFHSSQQSCDTKVSCQQYCLEVQQSCPFILPDNQDLIHGGTPSFICTGLLRENVPESKAVCCDVRWDSNINGPLGQAQKRTASSCQSSVTSIASPRLCSGRLKFCLLALVLLHTVIIISASHNSTMAGGTLSFWLEKSTSNED
ncbi:NALCN channel auxiliary factor 1 [Entelurus aequoreus]|uniref:NALCN channel auxiliary factor 1 n=1 Tax=Entelurus aequoreus TaxID=161455 RepID=UPI002B1E0BAE|nr:NALCN channel auxiliary factor 1 [Entelurus aequoreus]